MKEMIDKILDYVVLLVFWIFIASVVYHIVGGVGLVVGIAFICLAIWGHFDDKWKKENRDNRCTCLDYDGYALYCTCGYNPMTGKKDKWKSICDE